MEEDYASSGRSMDIELGGQEVITIDLENLDPNPEDVLDLLKEGGCRVWIWTKLAGEYWRRGYLDAAERIARSAVECVYFALHTTQTNQTLILWQGFEANGSTSSLPPVYALLANIQIANARQAPKIILPQAREFQLGNLSTQLNVMITEQDILVGSKRKEEYYREAALLLNTGERASSESGESGGIQLSFLTRGAWYSNILTY
jgi:RNA polymerase-associated protein CTR9